MPKLNRPPKLCRERNLAVVYSGGKRKSLRQYGSEEARRNYTRFVSEWKVNQQAAAVGGSGQTVVADLFLAYAEWAVDVLDPRDFGHCKTIIAEIVGDYGDISIDEFGSKGLATVQKRLELSGRFSYSYINKLLGYARTIFRWGVSQELVSPLTADALHYVQPLRMGRTCARINPPREDVPDKVVETTLPHLLPTVAAMVQVQRLAAMRPSEVCRMTVGDIDRSDEIWLYRPGMHKGAWRGHHRVIAPRLAGKCNENAVFSPRETLEEKKERDAANRKTPVQPSQQNRKKAEPLRKPGRKYSKDSYRTAIQRAVEKYNRNEKKNAENEGREAILLPKWFPYQIRHNVATEMRAAGEIETAQGLLGHTNMKTTEIYAQKNKMRVIDYALKNS